VDDLIDELDETRAKRLREQYGLRKWILSWMPEGKKWMARISGPGHADTIEAIGRTRFEAIERAARALEAVMPVGRARNVF
jgi:hypothetical protein